MNDKNNVNVAVIARFEENEEDFIKIVASEEHKINFVNIYDYYKINKNIFVHLKHNMNLNGKQDI